MADHVESMAYAHEVPWHGLGFQVNNDLTPAQMLKAAKLNWKVEKIPLQFQWGEGLRPAEDKFALVRSTDGTFFSVVGSVYRPAQNEDVADFFREFVVAGKMTMETMGSLWGGRYVWALAKIGKNFKLANGKDEVTGYLLLMSPHVIGKALVAMFTPIRVVCWNTLCMALGKGLKGGDGAFRMPHTIEFNDEVKENAKVALGLATTQMDEFRDVSQLLAKKKAKADEVEEFFCEVLQFDPKDAVAKKDGSVREPLALPKFRHALEHAPGQQMPSALGTWWGAVNAVTYVADHETGRDRGTALRNAWIGNYADIKRRAFDVAVRRAS